MMSGPVGPEAKKLPQQMHMGSRQTSGWPASDTARPRAQMAHVEKDSEAGARKANAPVIRATASARIGKASRRAKGLAAARVSGQRGAAPIAGAFGITIGRARFAWDLKPRRKPKKSIWPKAEEKIGPKVLERRVKARTKVRAMARKEFTASMAGKAFGKETL